METMIGWDVADRQLDALLHGSPLCLLLRHVLSYRDGKHDLKARVWVDTGVRDEEGIPTVYEEPVIYVTLEAMLGEHWHGKAQCLPIAEVPIIAAAIKPQIEAAIVEGWKEVQAQVNRFRDIINSLKIHRSKIQDLSEENP